MTFETKQENMILDINTDATNQILSIATVTDQRNMLARTTELVHKMVLTSLTSEEQAEFNAYQGVWSEIKAIRATAQIKKTAVQAATDLETLAAI